MKLDVYNEAGEKTGAVEIDDALLGKIVKRKLLSEVIRMCEMIHRAGTQSGQGMRDIRGSLKKPWRQKGTGRARQGSIRAVQWRGGALAHPPKPRDHYYSLPVKAIREAFKSSLLAKARDGEIKVLEDVKFEKPATKRAVKMLKALGVNKRKSLLITNGLDGNIYKSFRNIPAAKVMPVAQLNAYEVLKGGNLVFVKSSVDALVERVKV